MVIVIYIKFFLFNKLFNRLLNGCNFIKSPFVVVEICYSSSAPFFSQHTVYTKCGTNNMINRQASILLIYPIYIISVINVQKNTLKFHTSYFYNTRFYIPVIFTIPCFYIPVPKKKGQFIPAFVNTSSNIIVRGPVRFNSH